jgi:hypothetical protein
MTDGNRHYSNTSKTKVPTSVLPWKTKWKPSPEDKKYVCHIESLNEILIPLKKKETGIDFYQLTRKKCQSQCSSLSMI